MLPIISIVGRSKTGKTTLAEKLIAELKSRGYRVASIKHAQEIHFDQGKDSERHLSAGSEATAVATSDRFVMIKPISPATTLDEMAYYLGEEYDIIITEGFKQGNTAKIEVHRASVGPPLENIKRLIAIATDEPLHTTARQFGLDDVKALADLIEQGFIIPQSERLSLYINGKPLPLTMFPRKIIASVITNMAQGLKGVVEIKNLQVWLSKPTKLHLRESNHKTIG
jgi:molybdopterin-guanine dinucleotide biosynthesis protein B